MHKTVLPDETERKLPEFNAMQRVKRRLFAMRNGALASQMALHGAEYKINFGLNLPQISEIARDFLPGGEEAATLPEGFSYADFARRLRDNTTTRESMLIAPMLFPVEALDIAEALEWGSGAATAEVADVLCMKLLRNHPSAREIAAGLLAKGEGIAAVQSAKSEGTPEGLLAKSEGTTAGMSTKGEAMAEYAGLRLLMNLLQTGRIDPAECAEAIAPAEQHPTPLTKTLLRQLRQEIAFLSE